MSETRLAQSRRELPPTSCSSSLLTTIGLDIAASNHFPKQEKPLHRLSKQNMSSPANRRSQRNSNSATPRRSARNSQVPQSSPFVGPGSDEQLRSETSEAPQRNAPSQATPRASGGRQQNFAMSSPLFFRSSPVNGAAAGTALNRNRIEISSPLRQTSNAFDGDRTPKASGQTVGGKLRIQFRKLSIIKYLDISLVRLTP